MRVVRDPEELQDYVQMLHRNRISVGLIPTMGALHEGHRSLMRRSVRENDRSIASIYVNPLQFGPDEDFERYPRDLEADATLCAAAGVDVVFAPALSVMQPPGRTTIVRVEGVTEDYEGANRPGHFDGVSTIVTRLLILAQPNRAYFGQKDYQQTVVVRRLVSDLAIPSRIVVCPTVRDADGLALSSRNRYLTPEDRREALRLPTALRAAERAILSGEDDGERIREILREGLASERDDVRADYADLVHAETLVPLGRLTGRGVVLAALRLGETRLLDNLIVAPPGVPVWEG